MDPCTKPTTTSKDYWDKLERKERSTIRFLLSQSVLLNVSDEDIEVNIWGNMGSFYQSKPLVKKLFLQKKLFLLRMDENDPVT